MGLLLSHIRKVSVYPDMVTCGLSGGGNQTGGGKRGVVENFSKQSRHRLFCLLHSVEFKKVTFTTLTYPGIFPTNPRVWKKHLKEYKRLFELAYGKIRAIWRLEFQARGAPHWHIMYLDCPFIAIKEWCMVWAKAIKATDPETWKNGVDVKLISKRREKKLIVSYVAKYLAKFDGGTQDDPKFRPGRYWGRWNIPKPIPSTFVLTSGQASSVITELLRSRMGSSTWQPADDTICGIFGDNLGGSTFGRRGSELSGAQRP